MIAEQIERVFGRRRLKMATGNHVEVFREAAAPGERRRYTKRFLAIDDVDFRQWTAREWRILARLIGHGVRCVPDVVQFDGGAEGGMRQVQTYDAGITVDQWATLLPVARDGTVRRHIFEDCAHWWALAHHCLNALDEIHALQLVHLDVKADNICIPYDPANFDPASSGIRLYPAFGRLALIDFAFSLVSRETLATALPLGWQKDYDYQSPRLLRALEAGSAGDLQPTQNLDWRCDLYSLAAMLRRYLPNEEWARSEGAAAGWTPERYDDARTLIYRLRDHHDSEAAPVRPHLKLLAVTAAHMDEPDLAASLANGWTLGVGTDTAASSALLTPMTRIAAARPPAARTSGTAAPATAITAVPAVFRTTRVRVFAPPSVVAARSVRTTLRPRTPRLALLFAALATAAVLAAPTLLGDRIGSVANGVQDVVADLRTRFGAPSTEAADSRLQPAFTNSSTPSRATADASPESTTIPTLDAASADAAGRRGVGEAQPPGADLAMKGPDANDAKRETNAAETAGSDVKMTSSNTALGATEPEATRNTSAASPNDEVTNSTPELTASGAQVDQAQPEAIRNGTASTLAERESASTTGTSTPPTDSRAVVPVQPKSAEPLRAAASLPTALHPPANAARRYGTRPSPPAVVAPRQQGHVPPALASAVATRSARAVAKKPSQHGSAAVQVASAKAAPQPPQIPSTARAAPALQAAHPLAPTAAAHSVAQAAPASLPPVPAGSAAPGSQTSGPAQGGNDSSAIGGNVEHPPRPPDPGTAVAQSGGASEARPMAAAKEIRRAAPQRAQTDPWRAGLRDVLAALGVGLQRAAPVEERAVQAPQLRGQGATAGVLPAQTTPAERTYAEPPVRVEPPRVALADAQPVELARPVAAPVAQFEPPADRWMDPSARASRPSNVAMRASTSGESQEDLRIEGRRMLVELVPRIAAQARQDASPLLWMAATADDRSQDRALANAAYGRWVSERAYLPAPGAPERARPLHDEARRSFALGHDNDAADLELRAFAANPRDPDVAGFLALLQLRVRPAQPEMARQLALHALAFSGARRIRRIEDWNTFAIASALSGRELDATRGFLVALALSRDVEGTCRAAVSAYTMFGERLRAPVQALLYRVHAQGRDYDAVSCAWPAYRTAGTWQ